MSDDKKSIITSPEEGIFDYFEQLGWGCELEEADIYSQLNAKTREKFGDLSVMLSGAEIGRLLTMLTRLSKAKTCLEIGTFTGYSAMRIANGLEEKGKLYTFDASDEYVQIGKPFWRESGLKDKIEFILGDAKTKLREFSAKLEGQVDLAFIDADKKSYDEYYELILPMCRTQGIICFDNIWWSGKVADADQNDRDTSALRMLNKKLANDKRVDVIMLPMRDGLTVAQKK